LVGKPDGKIILQSIPGKRWEGADWTHLAQETDKWRALVNTVMTRRILQNEGNILTSWQTEFE